jgi:hypothetical protein
MTVWTRIVTLRERTVAKREEAFIAGGYSWDDPKYQLVCRQYDRLVGMLAAMAPHMDCWEIDPDLWDNYSDSYKSEYGIRPRSGSYAVVKEFIDSRVRQTRQHEAGECEEYCYVCAMEEEDAREVEWILDSQSRIDAEKKLAAALADDAPECLHVPVHSGRGRQEIHLIKHISHRSGVNRSLRAGQNRGRRSRQRAVLGQALKTQLFDIAC